MNQFGLGLIINAVDNASSVFDNITGSYNNMAGAFDSAVNSSVGANMSMLGDQIAAVGTQFTSFFSNIIGNVRTVGSEFEGFKLTLQSLYNETSENNPLTQKAIKDLFDFSIVSPFEVSDTKDLLVTLKSQGVEAFEELTDASGNTQKAMMWLTDLMAFKPDVDVSRWKLALTNFLGSGQGKVLENILDAGKIKQIIGHDIADTAEGRMKDLLEVIDKLGVRGLTESMSGTLETKLSNIQDFLTKFFYEIANSGAFEQVKRLIDNLSSAIIDDSVMTQENLESLAKGISDALHIFLDPVEKATEIFKEYSTQWLQYLAQRPKILSMAFAITTMTGVILIALGVFIKLGGVLTSFLASVKYLSGGKTLIALFTQSLWGIVRVIGPLVAGGYLMYKVWTMNIDNIQEKAKKLWEFLKNFVTLIADILPDNIMSKENYDLAKQMGLLPLIETFLNLKYYLGKFWEGFKKGFEQFINSMVVVFYKIMGFNKNLQPLFDKVKEFIKNITASGLEQAWTDAGEQVGKIAGWIVFIIAILPKIEKMIRTIIAIVKGFIRFKLFVVTAWGWLTGVAVPWITAHWALLVADIRNLWLFLRTAVYPSIVSAATTVWGWITAAYSWLVGTALPTIVGWFTSLAASLGVSVGVLLGIIAVVVAIIAVVYIFRDEIAAFLVESWWKVKDFFVKTGEKVSDFFSYVGESVKNTTKTAWGNIKSFFIGVWEEIKNNPVAQFLWSVIYAVSGFIYALFWTHIMVIGAFIQSIVDAVVDLGNLISQGWNSFATFCKGVWDEMQNNLINLWGSIDNFFTNIGTAISDFFKWVGGFFVYLWEDVILEFVDNVKLGWQTISDVSSEIVEKIAGFFSWLFSGIADLAYWLKDNIFAPIWDAISWIMIDAVQRVWDFISPIFTAIADFIDSFKLGLGDIVKGVTDIFTGIGDFFFGVGNYAKETVGLATGGYVKTEGIAMLHPNEVVVNDELTRGLGMFLSDYDKAHRTSTPLIKQDIISTDDYAERDTDNPLVPVIDIPNPEGNKPDNSPSPMQAITNSYYSVSNSENSSDNRTTNNNSLRTDNLNSYDSSSDNSIVFQSGSIVMNINGAELDFDNISDSDLNIMAERLMTIISRKMQLRNMQTRK